MIWTCKITMISEFYFFLTESQFFEVDESALYNGEAGRKGRGSFFPVTDGREWGRSTWQGYSENKDSKMHLALNDMNKSRNWNFTAVWLFEFFKAEF